MNWFRFYNGVLDDPKVQRLPGDVFKVWTNLLCLASRLNHRTGELPPVPDIAFALRLSVPETTTYLEGLAGEKLLDRTRGGDYAIHGWSNRQFDSDSSTARTRKWRKGHSNGNGDGPVTPDVTSHVTPPRRSGDGEGDALDQIRTDQNRSEQIINAGARDGGDDDDDCSILGIFQKLTGKKPTIGDEDTARRLEKSDVTPNDLHRGIELALLRSPGGRVNSLKYCVPVIKEVAAARVTANIGAWSWPERLKIEDVEAMQPRMAVGVDCADPAGGVTVGEQDQPAPKGGFSEADKTPVFAAVGAFVRRFAATNGRQPDRDELRAHLFDWCSERGIDLGLVDAMYPAAAGAAKE